MRSTGPPHISATPLRGRRGAHELDRHVETLLTRADRPIGGQRIVDLLACEGNPAPPSQVYRVLRHLLDQRRVKRIELLNAYMIARDGCDIVLVCTECGETQCTNAPAAVTRLMDSAAHLAFVPGVTVIEVLGLCPACHRTGPKGGRISECPDG